MELKVLKPINTKSKECIKTVVCTYVHVSTHRKDGISKDKYS